MPVTQYNALISHWSGAFWVQFTSMRCPPTLLRLLPKSNWRIHGDSARSSPSASDNRFTSTALPLRATGGLPKIVYLKLQGGVADAGGLSGWLMQPT